jgi:hypothetical protein
MVLAQDSMKRIHPLPEESGDQVQQSERRTWRGVPAEVEKEGIEKKASSYQFHCLRGLQAAFFRMD